MNAARRPTPALALAMLALVLGMPACSTQVNTVENADKEATPNIEALKRITLNPPLDGRVSIIDVYEGSTGSLKRIQANIGNRTNGRTWFQYRFDWFDKDGFVIEGPASAWTRDSLLAGQRKALTGLAPTPVAVDWRLTIRG